MTMKALAFSLFCFYRFILPQEWAKVNINSTKYMQTRPCSKFLWCTFFSNKITNIPTLDQFWKMRNFRVLLRPEFSPFLSLSRLCYNNPKISRTLHHENTKINYLFSFVPTQSANSFYLNPLKSVCLFVQ